LDWQDQVATDVADLQKLLVSKAVTVATAESCTGGLVATLLTELPGSSKIFRGGVSAYDNVVKTDVLRVPPALIAQHGAVSAAVAEAMARGAKELMGADFAVSLTGIAGPDGGSTGKPVGTVFCGIAGPRGQRSRLLNLTGTRTQIRRAAALQALAELRREVEAFGK
jgi:PncC family amidohydrolase